MYQTNNKNILHDMENYPKKVTMTVAFEVIYVSPEPISRADALRKAEELGGRFPTQIEALVISERQPYAREIRYQNDRDFAQGVQTDGHQTT